MRKITGDCVRSALLGMTVILLTACGGAGSRDMYNYEAAKTEESAAYDTDGGIYANEAPQEVYEEAVEEDGEAGAGEVTEAAVSDRKLIKNVDLGVETEQFDTLLPSIEQRVVSLGGYIEEMSSYSRNNSYSADYSGTKYFRYANMTVRIPREKLDAFLKEVGEQSNIVSRSERVTDVTLQYVDLESHKKALLTEQERLLQLLEQAGTVEDIIAIEGRLSEVRYQLESMESQLRTYDNKIDYSTVHLNIDEVEHYTPGEGASTSERIRNGFRESVEGVGRGFQNAAIWFVVNLPYLLVWGVLAAAALLLVRLIVRRQAKRREEKPGRNVNPYYPDLTAYQAREGQRGNQAGEQAGEPAQGQDIEAAGQTKDN